MKLTPVHPFTSQIPSPLQELDDPRLTDCGVRLFLKRDDLIHPDIPGNKWRKLQYNLLAAQQEQRTRLLTFGGAFSNHIRAVAAAGYYFGFETIGVIRGEEHLPLNPSLAYATARGMRLIYLDRTSYRNKTDSVLLDRLQEQFGPCYVVPEGGSNQFAVKGCAELPDEITVPYDVICCASGTGGTLAGISAGLPEGKRAIGFPVLKGGAFLADDIRRLQQEAYGREYQNWGLVTEYHFGGYAKRNAVLDAFIDDFKQRHGIELEWVYVAKMLYGVFDQIKQGVFPSGTTIVAVITGPPGPV